VLVTVPWDNTHCDLSLTSKPIPWEARPVHNRSVEDWRRRWHLPPRKGGASEPATRVG
jgi:hypothetical protein